MVLWQTASVAFFGYVILVVMIRSSRLKSVGRILAGAVLGLLIVAWSALAGQQPILNFWIWPPLVLLVAYWSSGMLFVAPSPSQEAALRWLDDRLAIQDVSRRTPRVLAEVLEAAYAGVYLLIPLALLAREAFLPSPDPDGFWSVVLITDFVCFGVLPWVQTRPPRALKPASPGRRLSAASICACSARQASRSTRSRAVTPPRRSPPSCSCSPRTAASSF